MSNTDFADLPVTQADVRAIHAHGYGMVNLGPTEDQMRVVFYWASILDKQKSRDAGRPIYDKVLFVKSHMPGEERLQENDRPATEEHMRRWPRQWAAFQQNREYVPEGTSIDFLFPDNPQIPAMLRWHGFHTVELLAKATPVAIETIGMGMSDWIAKAKRYLESSKKGVDFHQIKEMEERHAREIKTLTNQIADLVTKLNAMSLLANNVPTGQRQAVPFDAPAPVKQLPEERQWAAPNPEFITDDDENDDPRSDATRARSERMKAINAQRKANK